MDGACITNGRDEKYKIVAGKREGKRSFGNSVRSWEDNIKTDLEK
jgi:hypothetical protein